MQAGRKCGFTMIELLVVLAIIGVIATVSIPTIASMTSPKHVLRKEGRKLMQLMTEARSAAMNRKIRIDVFVDPVLNEVRAAESSAYRALMADELDEEERALAMSNRFERVLVFDEDFSLEAFSADQIVVPTEEEETFQPSDGPEVDVQAMEDHPEGEVRALWFTHFGGSDGGGISLYCEGVRLDIAADILTGRPKIVVRKTDE
jgi:prepilin-type N-terminal cleavage/methylation domain-containing protein